MKWRSVTAAGTARAQAATPSVATRPRRRCCRLGQRRRADRRRGAKCVALGALPANDARSARAHRRASLGSQRTVFSGAAATAAPNSGGTRGNAPHATQYASKNRYSGREWQTPLTPHSYASSSFLSPSRSAMCKACVDWNCASNARAWLVS